MQCHGLDFYHDAPVHLHVSYRPWKPDPPGIVTCYRSHALVHERQWGEVVCRFTDVATAVIDCLVSIFRGHHEWRVPHIAGLAPAEVQAIEILDLVRTKTGLTREDLFAEAASRTCRRRLKRLWKLSVAGVDSPPETHMRLILRDLADWENQTEFFDATGRYLTAADLYDPVSRLALFYDGEHHLQRSQRDYDSEVGQQLLLQGITPVRITAGQIRNPEQLRSLVSALQKRK